MVKRGHRKEVGVARMKNAPQYYREDKDGVRKEIDRRES
jgi:hypothetical protein